MYVYFFGSSFTATSATCFNLSLLHEPTHSKQEKLSNELFLQARVSNEKEEEKEKKKNAFRCEAVMSVRFIVTLGQGGDIRHGRKSSLLCASRLATQTLDKLLQNTLRNPSIYRFNSLHGQTGGSCVWNSSFPQ